MNSLSALKGTIPVALVGSHAIETLRENLESEIVFSVKTYNRISDVRKKQKSSEHPRIVVISASSNPPDDIIDAAKELLPNSMVILLASGIQVDKALRMSEAGIDAVCCSLEQEGVDALKVRLEELALVSVLMPNHLKARTEPEIRRAVDCLKQDRISSIADWAYAAVMSGSAFRKLWKNRCGIAPIDSLRLWRIYRAALGRENLSRAERQYVDNLIRRKPELLRLVGTGPASRAHDRPTIGRRGAVYSVQVFHSDSLQESSDSTAKVKSITRGRR